MRKVFISTALLSPFSECEYRSEDYDIEEQTFQFPISYMLNRDLVSGDRAVLLTIKNEEANSIKNYALLKEEATKIAITARANIEFVELSSKHVTYNHDVMIQFFKSIVDMIQEGDRLYFDMTYGIKPNSFAIMVALNYVERAFTDVYVEEVIYAERYRGSAGAVNIVTLYDLTSIFHLNAVVGKATPNTKKGIDNVLRFMIDSD